MSKIIKFLIFQNKKSITIALKQETYGIITALLPNHQSYHMSTLRKHSSYPQMRTASEIQNYQITNNQSQHSQLNPIQSYCSLKKQRYFPNPIADNKTQSYQPYRRDKFLGMQVQTQSNQYTRNKKYQQNPYFYLNPNPRQNIIEVNNWRNSPQYYHPYNQNKNFVKNKLSRNVYLTKQKTIQKKNTLDMNFDKFITPQQSYPSSNSVQFKKHSDYSIEGKQFEIKTKQNQITNNYQQLLSNNQQMTEGKLNRAKSQQNLSSKKFQFSNHLLGRFTFKDNQPLIEDVSFSIEESQLPSKPFQENTIQFKQRKIKNSYDSQLQNQTKYLSKVSSQPQYCFQFRKYSNKPIITPLSSRQQSEKQSHFIYELKQSANNSSTDDSGIVLASLQETKSSALIKQLQQQNQLLQKENIRIKNQIQQKIHIQKQLLFKSKKIMKLIENLKSQEIEKLQSNRQSSQKCPSRESLLEINSRLQGKKYKETPNQMNHIRTKFSKQAQFRDSFDLLYSSKANNPIYEEFELQIQSPQTLRTHLENDTILGYSPIDSQSFNPKKEEIRHFPSHTTLKDDILESRQNLKKENQIKSKTDFGEASITGFESYFMPRQSNLQKLQELEQLFEKQITKSYSLRHGLQKTENLRRLSEQIKNLRTVVEKQSSDSNLNMLLFSNTSLK